MGRRRAVNREQRFGSERGASVARRPLLGRAGRTSHAAAFDHGRFERTDRVVRHGGRDLIAAGRRGVGKAERRERGGPVMGIVGMQPYPPVGALVVAGDGVPHRRDRPTVGLDERLGPEHRRGVCGVDVDLHVRSGRAAAPHHHSERFQRGDHARHGEVVHSEGPPPPGRIAVEVDRRAPDVGRLAAVELGEGGTHVAQCVKFGGIHAVHRPP
ncbi:MAG: hypothetical protein IPG46_09195 [Actinobacteria bacterium]|nr:hypothetical protein [Actinomycetota bacterium]